MLNKVLIDFLISPLKPRFSFQKCFSILNSVKEIRFYNCLIILNFLAVKMTHRVLSKCENELELLVARPLSVLSIGLIFVIKLGTN